MSNQPLGTGGDLQRRFLYHHAPLAFATAVGLAVFMSLPVFDANAYSHADIFSGRYPQQRGGNSERVRGGANETRLMDHGRDHAGAERHDRSNNRSMRHGSAPTAEMDHGGDRTGTQNPGAQSGRQPDRTRHRSFKRQWTMATGYIALGLLGLTLLVAPANLALRKRNPVSNYLSRDIGAWAAIASGAHVIFGLLVHGGGRIRDFLDYFVAPDGKPLTNSFGLANWSGLAALVIVVGLLAISSDVALRKLKARSWKRVQRLNYALFLLVILHSFFYGALLRVRSPYTFLLVVTVIAVFVGQAVGIWLWWQKYARTERNFA